MAKEKKAPGADAESAVAKGGSRQKALVAVAALALLGGAGYVVTGGGGDAEAAEAVVEDPAAVPGVVVPLEPVTLNLADGRFLKVGLALQLVDGVAAPAAADVDAFAAPALDEAITLLGARTYAQLVVPEGRQAAKAELSDRVRQRYEDDVMGVLFTELVMQ
ncbi:MAG TPA: flagellar basal body-associated FliL family protein [Acidimicrobiales bacterium]|nr:flagellar basal body-associated FliL family protein [Acidimicrobiales bacterium]